VGIVIPRPRIQDYLAGGGRRLLYGRRKTGKTFIARQTLPDHKYYIVRRNRRFYQPEEDYEAGLREVLLECRHGQPLIIDEFHRADPRLYDALQAGECSEVVLITSTLHFFRRLVQGRDAPLAGLFQGLQVPLIHPVELLAASRVQHILVGDPKRGVETVLYWQEPVWVGAQLPELVQGAYTFTLSLTSEVLAEEEATYSQRLLAILSAVAAGKSRLAEIASYLYTQGLIPSQSTGHIVKYIGEAVRVGLLERVPIYGAKRRGVYRHASPVTHLALYLQEKYYYYDVPTSPGTGLKLAENITPLQVEHFLERLLSHLYKARPVKILNPETDIALARGRSLVLAAEVKWRSHPTPAMIRRAEQNLARLPAQERLIIVPDKTGLPEPRAAKLLDVHDLIEAAAGGSPTWR